MAKKTEKPAALIDTLSATAGGEALAAALLERHGCSLIEALTASPGPGWSVLATIAAALLPADRVAELADQLGEVMVAEADECTWTATLAALLLPPAPPVEGAQNGA